MRDVVFAGNARYGAGGQGEFLRQMAATLGGREGAALYARDPGPVANGIAVPRGASARAALRLLRSVPGLRGRDDFIDIALDTTGQRPQVVGRISYSRGSRTLDEERPIKPGASPESLTEEDVLEFFLGALEPWLER